jgi:hypothetical protein
LKRHSSSSATRISRRRSRDALVAQPFRSATSSDRQAHRSRPSSARTRST